MPKRARMAFSGAGAVVGLLVLTWFAAFHVGFVERADRSILRGFAGLHRPRVDDVTSFVAQLCNPKPYVYLAAIPIAVALLRRRPRVAVTIGLVLLGANMTTQVLKPLLAAPRWSISPLLDVSANSWPSGHATAAMSLALCSVIAAPPRWRPIVGAAMAAFAVAVCFSFLELGWHYPTDVLGGFEIATAWSLLGAGTLWWFDGRRAERRGALIDPAPVKMSIAETLAPMAILVAGALFLAAIVAVARPHAVVSYASDHLAFIVGAAGIAMLGMVIATGATLALRR